MTAKEKHIHTNERPGMSEHTADFLAEKQRESHDKAALHNYAVEDKREVARHEHTNGSTRRSDQ